MTKVFLVSLVGLGSVVGNCQGLDFFLYSSRVQAELLANGFTGYTYNGPFNNQTHLIASAARINAALEDLAGFDINNWALTNTVITNVPNLLINSITYTNSYWDDSQVPAMGFRVGTTAPDFAQFTDANIYCYQLSASQDDIVYGSVQLSHRYKKGTDLECHVHYAPMTAPAGSATNVVWQFSYSLGKIGSAFPASTTVNVTNSVAGFAQFSHKLKEFTTISGAGVNGSDILMFKLSRLGSSASDTYDNSIALLSFDLHFQLDKPGSDNELPD